METSGSEQHDDEDDDDEDADEDAVADSRGPQAGDSDDEKTEVEQPHHVSSTQQPRRTG